MWLVTSQVFMPVVVIQSVKDTVSIVIFIMDIKNPIIVIILIINMIPEAIPICVSVHV